VEKNKKGGRNYEKWKVVSKPRNGSSVVDGM
jgi:hypothetical protein